jgi:hypothetical protein
MNKLMSSRGSNELELLSAPMITFRNSQLHRSKIDFMPAKKEKEDLIRSKNGNFVHASSGKTGKIPKEKTSWNNFCASLNIFFCLFAVAFHHVLISVIAT